MKTIALCFSTPGLDKDEWINPDYGKRFPGAGFMRHLNSFDGKNVIAGKLALDWVVAGADDPKNIIVVQEENNEYGQELIKRGADPRVQMCLESPIFASKFYDNIGTEFKHRLLFDGGTEHIYFPSFDDEDIKEPMPWNERKFMCMVTSNKHYSMLPKLNSPSFLKAMETQLHDYRYNAIKHFLPKEDFDLYGKGWNVHGIGDRECTDKLETIRKYKFALCFENGAYPGYITEKIIDCFVAGVIPVYMGASDIQYHFPSYLYIDARSYKSFDEMYSDLKDRSNNDIYKSIYMTQDAQEWLKISGGRRYNNKVFAEHILELCAG